MKDQFGSQGGWKNKPILECKSIQDLKFLSDGKQYRVWNKKFKNALEQARPKSREVITWLETVKEKAVIETKKEDLDDTMAGCIMSIAELEGGTKESIREKMNILKDLNRDLWALLQAKAKGEALQKASAVKDGEGLWSYVKMHRWFMSTTDLGKTNQRIDIMKPQQCKHDWEVAEAVQKWEEKSDHQRRGW